MLAAVLLALLAACRHGSSGAEAMDLLASAPEGDPAYDLAKKVAWYAGYDHLDDVGQINFRLVEIEHGERIVEVEHRWDLVNEIDRIRWSDRAGQRFEAYLDIRRRRAEGSIDGAPVEGAALEALAERAYHRHVHDTRWILLPIRLFDRNADLRLGAPLDFRGKRHLVLEYRAPAREGAGDLTRLLIDPDSFRIARAEHEPSGGPAITHTWEDYRPVGPLLVAHEHKRDGDAGAVVLEEASAFMGTEAP